MNFLRVMDFPLSVQSNAIPGISTYRKFGINRDVDTAAVEDVWATGGTLSYSTTARTQSVVSTSLLDTAAGTGARTVVIIGLNSSYVETSETVTLNGIVAVNTVNSYLRILRAYVATAGSGESNAGTITVTANIDLTTQATIAIGTNQAQKSHFTVPAGKSAYIRRFTASVGKASGTDVNAEIEIQFRELNSVWRPIDSYELNSAGNGLIILDFMAPPVCPEKTDIRVRCTAYQNNVVCAASYELFLVTN